MKITGKAKHYQKERDKLAKANKGLQVSIMRLEATNRRLEAEIRHLNFMLEEMSLENAKLKEISPMSELEIKMMMAQSKKNAEVAEAIERLMFVGANPHTKNYG